MGEKFKMKEELISIVVPIYNTEKYLENCLNSIIKQTYKNIEIILVNDGSPDKSKEIIKKYLKKDNRIVAINKKNGGLSSARNAGIKIAKGKYIFNVDSDDWIEKKACENLLKAAIKNKSDIVIGNIIIESKKKKKWYDLSETKNYSFKEYFEEFLKGKTKPSIWNKLIKKELYLKNNILHPNGISLGEDSATLLRLVTKAHRITKISSFVYHYRINENSMMNNSNKKILEYYKVFKLVKNYYLNNNLHEFFYKAENIFKYRIFYKAVILFSKKNAIKNNRKDYIIGWRMLEKDLKKIVNDEIFKKNVSFLERFLLVSYSRTFVLGDFLVYLYKKVKR